MGKIDFGPAFSKGWEGFSKNIANLVIGFLLTGIISITIILAPIMIAGLTFMLLKALRGESTEINDVFVGFSDFGRYFLGGLILLGVNLLGVLACGIGLVVTNGITLFLFFLMVDKGLRGGEALRRCWEYFKTDWLMAILLAVVTGIVSSVGSSFAGIGLLITGPFAFAVVGAAYLQVFGAPAAPVEETPVVTS